MDSMIERVARAMFRIGKDHWPTAELNDSEDRNWREKEDEARAAITAMREPTEAMIAAGVEARCEHGESQCGAAYSWQEMIDFALKEGE